MGLTKSYVTFMLSRATQGAFGAYEAEGVDDTAEFSRLFRLDEARKLITVSKSADGETVTITKEKIAMTDEDKATEYKQNQMNDAAFGKHGKGDHKLRSLEDSGRAQQGKGDHMPDEIDVRKFGARGNALEQTDERSKAVQKTPWRVSLDGMKKQVLSVEYIYPKSIPHMTIAIILLKNGYALQGMSAPADPANFNEALGQEYAYEDAMKKLWSLEAYVMRDVYSGASELTVSPEERWPS